MEQEKDTKKTTGGALAGALSLLGLPCECVAENVTANTIFYHFNLTNIKDYPKIKKVVNLLTIDYHISAETVKSDIGHFAVEVMREKREIIPFFSAYSAANIKPFRAVVGLSTAGEWVTVDVNKMVSGLCVGTSGSGKSNFLHCFINSLTCSTSPEKLRFLLIDCKRAELMQYNDRCCHLMAKVCTTAEDANFRLTQIIDIMQERYKIMEERHTNTCPDDFPRIVIIVDELAELMLTANKRQAENTKTALTRLCQLGRACGIHCLLCTQSPRVSVVDGLIQTNTPTKFALRTSNTRESVIAIGHGGCERLCGCGDMIYKPADDVKEIRLQVPYISTDDITNIYKNLPVKEWNKPTPQPTKKTFRKRLSEAMRKINKRREQDKITYQDCIDFDTMDDDE